MRHFFTSLLLLLISLKLPAQSGNIPVEAEETPDEEMVYLAEEQAQQPLRIDLNKAGAVELTSTGLLSIQQIQAILAHRRHFGNFLSVYELQSIAVLSPDTLLLLSDKIYIATPLLSSHHLNELLAQGKHSQLCRWSRKSFRSAGYRPNNKGERPYEGSDYQLLYRFRSSFAQTYQAGITLEKDAGESFRWKARPLSLGFDYASAYLLLYPKKIIRQVALGDFQFRSGHGLVFGGNFFLSKNPEFWSSAWQMGNGFRPHSSSSEYGFFRGIGVRYQRGALEGSAFCSRTLQDATLQADGSVSAYNVSGLHRTGMEKEKRHNASLQHYGGNLCYTSGNQRWHAGAEYLMSRFDPKWAPPSTYYRRHAFQGNVHHIGGLFMQYRHASGIAFGEAAFSSGQGKAFYGGLVQNLSKHHLWIFQCWSANNAFQSFQANIPSFSSTLANETGTYQSLLLALTKTLRLSLGWGTYYRSSPSYSKKGPDYGNEWIGRLTWQCKRKTAAYIQFRWRDNSEDFRADSSAHSYLVPLQRYYLSLDLSHTENLRWSFHSRGQWVTFTFPQKEKGYCLTQSFSYRWKAWKSTAQISVFQSDSWDSRLYTYETDVPLAFSIPALSGEGIRWAWVNSFALWGSTVSLKLSHVRYQHQASIGSGYDEVPSNRQWEVRIQTQLNL